MVLVTVFALVTTLLSWWQFSRREERVAKIELVMQNYDAPALLIEQLGWEFDSSGNPVAEWRRAKISGGYIEDSVLLVRNRPLSGSPGFLQLALFESVQGEVFVIERGWLPAGSEITEPVSNPKPSSLVTEIEVRLRAGEADLNRGAVAGQLASIDLGEIADLNTNLDLETRFYGRLVTESPPSEALPIPMPKPSLDEGNHLSYALQWLLFGIMAFAALFWTYRNELRIREEEQGLRAPKTRRQTQADDDAVFEDANQ
ncbi:SURF1 family protein [Aquiluna borgnonia]|uniref:SURF1-like protein n=1 Tax=Aquiluna borgnonia TaxID=2499157 RepID=A0A7D4PQN7_9MICO|nr:SURF1 family protein [Aquiluna borgnonia]QKJ25326.1 SURF1 family protein [Aquiluna borgnonia]